MHDTSFTNSIRSLTKRTHPLYFPYISQFYIILLLQLSYPINKVLDLNKVKYTYNDHRSR